MNIKIHDATEKPKINTLCLVFYKERLFQPVICAYLDNSTLDVELLGDGEGFYVTCDPYGEGHVDPRIIAGWVDLYKLDELVKGGGK